MKVAAAFLLAVLGGNANPSADNIKNIIGAGEFMNVFRMIRLCYCERRSSGNDDLGRFCICFVLVVIV